jgi:sortase A
MQEKGRSMTPGYRDYWRSVLPLVLLIGGAVLAFLGGRDLLEACFGQSAAARTFGTAAPSPGEPRHARIPLGETMAKLSIPRLAAQLYVIEGDSPAELRRGPGHLADSASPGESGNCVIAGHRDTHFRVLKGIRRGDEILLQTERGRFRYRVSGTSVVSPADTRALQPTRSPVLTLITCYPFYYVGASPKRFVVEAKLAGATPQNK